MRRSAWAVTALLALLAGAVPALGAGDDKGPQETFLQDQEEGADYDAIFRMRPEESASDSDSRRRLFVVETDAESAAQSLDRISGDVDTGFTTPDQSYESQSHASSGVFSRN